MTMPATNMPARLGESIFWLGIAPREKWLVVELKRNDTSDSVVGQVLRYMGWIRQHLADPGDEVHGLIIAREGDEALHYASKCRA